MQKDIVFANVKLLIIVPSFIYVTVGIVSIRLNFSYYM